MRLRVAFFAYRNWAFQLIKRIKKAGGWEIAAVYSPVEHEDAEGLHVEFMNPKNFAAILPKLRKKEIEILIFIGWSWIVPKEILGGFKCVCLHPSPLPKYRGGSPLQNQIIRGEEESAVTLFFMTVGLDDGGIIEQKRFSLDGELADIFNRLAEVGAEAVMGMLDRFAEGDFSSMKQDESNATVFKRRKPAESEIRISDFKKKSAKELHNFVRALQDPYPNAFIVCKDGKKLYILKTKMGE